MCVSVCVCFAYLANFCRSKDHIQDAYPAANDSYGDSVGQRYHQEPQVAGEELNTSNISDFQFNLRCAAAPQNTSRCPQEYTGQKAVQSYLPNEVLSR